MRIAYITAHLPPDFVSGAALAVDRLARAASRRGHDVEVFSGAIAAGLADGEVRTADGAQGPTVHWFGTATRVEQQLDENWRNPLAGDAVRAWLHEFGPDVVHLHTLQTLGVDVVEAAVTSGARTVVTMHDMWWWCARLFLVDTSLRPCNLVTDVATCACSNTPTWRAERAATLVDALRRVDRVLVPSAALRDLVIANGLDPDRVTVDENDIDEPGAEPAPLPDRGDGAPVRLLYLGGDNPLKGAAVLDRAIEQLADTPGWTLDAYGATATFTPSESVRVHPAFDHDDLGSVLETGDAVVIPSIARESFSVVAREALTAGLAVITSDCFGPEEVVRDGENGLIVPTGDSDALAAAIGRLVHDPGLSSRLRAGAREHPIAWRSLDDHVESLVATYETLQPEPQPIWPNTTFVVGADGAIARYRVHHPAEALRLHDASVEVTHYLDPALRELAADSDVVVMQRVPATVGILSAIEHWRRDGRLVLFDTDDLIFDPDLVDQIPGLAHRPLAERELYLDGLHRYRATLEACDGAIVSTHAIAAEVERVAGRPAEVVQNGLGLVDLRLAEHVTGAARPRRRRWLRARRRRRIGYLSGSDTHQADLDEISHALGDVLATRPDCELVLVGPVSAGTPLARLGRQVTTLPLQPWSRLPELIASLDVNLAPLVTPSRFNDAKSAVKWLEAAAVGVPTVATATAAHRAVIEDGTTGLLCPHADDWHDAITTLLDDDPRRERMGASAQRRVMLHHGPHVTAHEYRQAIDALRARTAIADERVATPLAVPDERLPSAPVLDPYEIPVARRRRFGRR